MTTVSIVSIEDGTTNYRIRFPQTTIIIDNFTLTRIGNNIRYLDDADIIKDKTTGTEYRLDFSREALIITREDIPAVEVLFTDFRIAIDKSAKCANNAKDIAKIYGPKILTEVILKAMNHGKIVAINDMSTFGYKILGYDGYAFEVEIPGFFGTHPGRRFILHSHVNSIGIRE